jgi:hypothetical protein
MKYLTNFLVAMALAMVGVQAHATLIVTPDDCVANCATGTVTDTNELISFIETMYGAEELYRSDIGSGDSMSFADSYNTGFLGLDNSGALIEYVAGGENIACIECFLLVKDGIAAPPWYLFDISGWDGLTNISLSDFWPAPDHGISHISVFGGGELALLTTSASVSPAGVPEPTQLALLGIGLLSMLLFRLNKAG